MEAFDVYVYVALRYVTATITLGLRYSYNYDDRFLLLRLLCLRNTGSVGLIMYMCVCMYWAKIK